MLDYSYSVIWLVIFILTVLLAGWYTYISGLCHKVQIQTGCPIFGTVLIAYKFYVGSNSRSGAQAVDDMNRIYGRVPNRQVIKICYDDPHKIAADKQRFLVGAVLSDENMNTNTDLETAFKKQDFQVLCISRISNAVLATFPCYTRLSVFLGKQLVYPKLKKFIKRGKLCAYPYIEFHQDHAIHFVVPLCEQRKFMVQEYEETILSDDYYEKFKKIK